MIQNHLNYTIKIYLQKMHKYCIFLYIYAIAIKKGKRNLSQKVSLSLSIPFFSKGQLFSISAPNKAHEADKPPRTERKYILFAHANGSVHSA